MNAHNLKCKSGLSRQQALKSKQGGTFSIELAMVGVFFSLLIAFSGDVIIKLSLKGKLDRLSYSLVNVIKERTQLYDSNFLLTSDEVNEVDTIAQHSLRRTFLPFDAKKYGLLVEELSFQQSGSSGAVFSERRGDINCHQAQIIDELQPLTVISNRGRQMPLYRVTVCYATDNWIGNIVGEVFTHVMSDSVVIGR